ncbi:hypothetical protein OsJ_10865 [Oryza sativa Japonica Group]|uniref:Argonaute linker 1 domain-containing protein n=1 Tax=Oryza sativa subsp. japonica TaxID=39947 RepID=B9F8G9_ORYSJ|nr:hypothetical protein OsJ_10865 [Oryza sativa Japonica Group]
MAYDRGGGRGEQQPRYGDPAGCSAPGEGGGGEPMAPYRPTATGFVWAPLRMSGRPQQHEPPPMVDVVVYYGARAAIPAPHDQAAYELGGAVLWRSAPLMEESTLPPPAAAGGEAVAVAASDIDPVRPGCGASNGKKVMIEENDLFCDFVINTKTTSSQTSRILPDELIKLHGFTTLGGKRPAYDGRESLYTNGSLPFESKESVVKVFDPEKNAKERAQKEFKITIEIVGKTNLYHLQRFLLGKHRGIAQEIIHVFDVILSDKLSRNHVTGPRSFLCTQIGHQGYIGDGLDSWRGYHQSLRLRKIGISLNTDMSAASFMPVRIIQIIDGFLNISYTSRPLLERNRVQLKKVLCHVCIETNHHDDQIGRYKITGITPIPMSNNICPVGEEGTTMTVLQYFCDMEKTGVPSVGHWNIAEEKIINGGALDNWTSLNLSRMRPEEVQRFCSDLIQMCNATGMSFYPRPVVDFRSSHPNNIQNALRDVHRPMHSYVDCDENHFYADAHCNCTVSVVPSSSNDKVAVEQEELQFASTPGNSGQGKFQVGFLLNRQTILVDTENDDSVSAVIQQAIEKTNYWPKDVYYTYSMGMIDKKKMVKESHLYKGSLIFVNSRSRGGGEPPAGCERIVDRMIKANKIPLLDHIHSVKGHDPWAEWFEPFELTKIPFNIFTRMGCVLLQDAAAKVGQMLALYVPSTGRSWRERAVFFKNISLESSERRVQIVEGLVGFYRERLTSDRELFEEDWVPANHYFENCGYSQLYFCRCFFGHYTVPGRITKKELDTAVGILLPGHIPRAQKRLMVNYEKTQVDAAVLSPSGNTARFSVHHIFGIGSVGNDLALPQIKKALPPSQRKRKQTCDNLTSLLYTCSCFSANFPLVAESSDGSSGQAVERVRDVLISPASTADELPTPLRDKPAADKAAVINVLPLTDVIGPLVDHQTSSSLREKVVEEVAAIAAGPAAARGSGLKRKRLGS